MIFITDHLVYDPIVRALLEVRFDVKRINEILQTKPDRFVMQACLENDGILITMDRGIPSQAYYYEFGQNGLTVVVLRWKTATPTDWQQMVEVILREANKWREAAKLAPSIISVSYKRGSRIRAWSTIPPIIALEAKSKELHDDNQGLLLIGDGNGD